MMIGKNPDTQCDDFNPPQSDYYVLQDEANCCHLRILYSKCFFSLLHLQKCFVLYNRLMFIKYICTYPNLPTYNKT